MKAETDTWMYSKDGPELFLAGDEIPHGYVDSPAKLGAPDEAPKRRGRPPKIREDE